METTFEHNGELLEIPDHIAMQISDSYTIEDAKKVVINAHEGSKKEFTIEKEEDVVVDEEPQDELISKDNESNDVVVDDADGKKEEETPVAEVVPYYAKHGIASEEEADKVYSKWKELSEKEQNLLQREALLAEVDNPFADDDDAKVAQFKKETGLKGRVGNDVASTVLLTPIEQVKDDPILAKAIALVIDNPTKLKNFSFQDIVGKVQRDAEKLGVDFDNKESNEYKDFIIDSFDSLDKIEKYREKFGTKQGILQSLQSQRQAQNDDAIKKMESFRANVNNARPEHLTHTFDGKEVKWETPKDILAELPEYVQRKLAMDHDITTDKGRDAVKREINSYLTVTKAISGELAKEAYNKGFSDAKASADKSALQLRVNGGQRHDRSGKAEVKTSSPIQDEINAAYGIKE